MNDRQPQTYADMFHMIMQEMKKKQFDDYVDKKIEEKAK